MGAVTELVLPGSGIHIQWNEEVGGWRFLTSRDADDHRMGTVVTPVSWRHWTGDPASIITRPAAATVTINDEAAVTFGFGQKVERRLHYAEPAEPQVDQPDGDGYRRGRGWYGKSSTGDSPPPNFS
jgi:hypothetical protein